MNFSEYSILHWKNISYLYDDFTRSYDTQLHGKSIYMLYIWKLENVRNYSIYESLSVYINFLFLNIARDNLASSFGARKHTSKIVKISCFVS